MNLALKRQVRFNAETGKEHIHQALTTWDLKPSIFLPCTTLPLTLTFEEYLNPYFHLRSGRSSAADSHQDLFFRGFFEERKLSLGAELPRLLCIFILSGFFDETKASLLATRYNLPTVKKSLLSTEFTFVKYPAPLAVVKDKVSPTLHPQLL
ncbi:hypothetical protein L207DRAFT_130829 [Hyaloscypha variabilis F]|uniref:Uncharacterized protein n=1 Tax=Hyaloscypha variabilis (strain UAMH 11265 / GT02V1 / F) TaxID=1149755 RepID=A0A2J6R933_HYAVF|nr:hypothetical protein L207DRAFT_130829 [Hyaloscypha variabilis F]